MILMRCAISSFPRAVADVRNLDVVDQVGIDLAPALLKAVYHERAICLICRYAARVRRQHQHEGGRRCRVVDVERLSQRVLRGDISRNSPVEQARTYSE